MIRLRTRDEPKSVVITDKGGSVSIPTQSTVVVFLDAKSQSLKQLMFLGQVFVLNVDYIVQSGSLLSKPLPGQQAQGFVYNARVRALVDEYCFKQIPLSPINPRSAVVSAEYASMADTVTPQFKRKRDTGVIVNNAMFARYDAFQSSPTLGAEVRTGYIKMGSASDGPGRLKISWWSGATLTSKAITHSLPAGFGKGLADSVLPTVDSGKDSAVADAYAKLQQAELDLAIMAAESKETVQYLVTVFSRLRRLLELCRDPKTLKDVATRTYRRYKKRIDKVGWTAKQLAEAYLEVRYAIRPLLYDIQDTYDYLSGTNQKPKQNRFTYRKQHAGSSSYQNVVSRGADGSVTEFSYTLESSARAGVLAERRLSDSAASRFGFLNLANVAWEKVRYSFILDWIVNMSGLLYRLNPNLTMKPLAAWVTEKFIFTAVGTYTPPSGAARDKVPFSVQTRVVERSVVSGPPMVVVDINLDFLKVLDISAIIGGFKRGKAPF